MRARAAKWWVTMATAWQTHAAYRLNFVLLVIGPSLVFFFVKVSLWTSIYSSGGVTEVGGVTQDQMLAYQCYVLAVALLSQGFDGVALAQAIRFGRITAHLMHPFPFLEYQLARWLAFQVLQLGVVAVLLGGAVASGLLPTPAPGHLAAGVAFSCLVALLWFCLQVAIGLLAFWLEQTWVLRVILRDCSAFLSGSLLPVELYPAWLRELLFYTPFPYLAWVPAKIFAGQYPHVGQASLVVLGWILVAGAACLFIWNRGLRLYSAAGM